jgi:hypothetical protein
MPSMAGALWYRDYANPTLQFPAPVIMPPDTLLPENSNYIKDLGTDFFYYINGATTFGICLGEAPSYHNGYVVGNIFATKRMYPVELKYLENRSDFDSLFRYINEAKPEIGSFKVGVINYAFLPEYNFIDLSFSAVDKHGHYTTFRKILDKQRKIVWPPGEYGSSALENLHDLEPQWLRFGNDPGHPAFTIANYNTLQEDPENYNAFFGLQFISISKNSLKWYDIRYKYVGD